MPEETKEQQSFEKKHEWELSATRYALKQLVQWGVSLGSTVVGGAGGYLLGKHKPEWVDKTIIKQVKKIPSPFIQDPEVLAALESGGAKKGVAAFLGAMAGATLAGVALMFEHWKKEESQKLAVDEMNTDISTALTMHERTNPELLAENNTLREMWNAERQKTQALQMKAGTGPTTRIQTSAVQQQGKAEINTALEQESARV